MILYLAGSLKPELYERIANRACANHFLFTFADKEARKCAEYFCTQPDRRIFIDSGAFSAWSKGAKIDLGDYITFCKKIMGMAKCPVVFAALDVISGKKEDAGLPTRDEIDRACDEGWDNYRTMQQEGIEPCLMTFHQFDHKRWLTKIAEDSNYFAVAPRKAGVSTEEKLKWLKQDVFRYIQPLDTSNGARGLRKQIHGLGVSSVPWMKQFPFFSVDNTDWLLGRKNLYRHSGGWMEREKWERLAVEWGLPTRLAELGVPARLAELGLPTLDLSKMLGHAVPGEKSDPDATYGLYWLMFIAMTVGVKTGIDVTEHWRSEGLILDHYQDAHCRMVVEAEAQIKRASPATQ